MTIRKNKLLRLVAILTVLAGLMVCFGWLLDIQVLKSISPRYASMKFNTAVWFMLTGLAFYLLVQNKTGFLFRLLCGVIFTFAFASVSQHLFDSSLGIDQLFMKDTDAGREAIPHPGRPDPVASVCFSLLAVAYLATASAKERRKRFGQFLYPLVSLFSFIAMLGYMYHAPGLYKFTFPASMALHTAAGLFGLSVSGSLVHHEKGLPGLFIGNRIGNIMARNLFPKIVAIAFVLGYLRLFAYHNQLVPPEFGFALYTIAFVIVGLFLVWYNANDLNEMDAKRLAAESKRNDEKFRALIENSHEAISLAGKDGEIIYCSPAAERMTGYPWSELQGEKVTSFLHADDVAGTFEFYRQILQEPGVPKYKSHRFLHKDGHYIWTEGIVTNLLDNPNIGAIVSNFHDISERKKAEQDLLESELRYRSLFEQASDAIMITDLDGNFLDVNISLCKLFGYSKEELLQLNIRTLIDPAQLKAQPMRFDRLAKGEHVFSERRMQDKSGNLIEVEANVKMLFDGRVVAIARDITARKKAEKELQHSESRFRNIAERAPVAIACYLSNGEMIFLNSCFTEITGYELNDLPTTGTWYELAFPDKEYRDRISRAVRMQLENFRENGIHTSSVMEVDIVCKNGTVKTLEVSRAIYDDRVYVIASDSTERKKAVDALAQSELYLRTIFETEPECVKLMNEQCELIDMNPAGLAMLEAENINALKGQSVLGLIHPKDREAFMQLNREVFRGISGTLQFEIISLKGVPRWMETHAVPMKDKNGSIISQLAISRDITARKKAEEEIHRSHQELRELSSYLESIREEERTHIAREIHDELGQQLTVLKMDASWISKKIPVAETPVQEKISDMIALIDDTVKTMRRISSALRPGILDDLGLLPALEWQSSEFEKRCGIECKFSSTLSEQKFDQKVATGLFRIYQEALTNIARHSGATKVQSAFDYGDANNLVLIIHDNGKGFDSEEIKSKTTLGIAGMKERAKLMRGELVIGSLRSQGTTIMIKVPRTENK